MELGGTNPPQPAQAAVPQPTTSPPSIQSPAQSRPSEPPKPKGIFGALGNPKMSKESRQVLEKLNGNKPFQIAAEKYGQAIAESIMLQSQAVMSNRVNFEEDLKKVVEFKNGSYSIICKGTLPVRLSPFIWQLDQGTRRSWMVFSFNNFYGHKDPRAWEIWKKFWKILVITPFDSTSNMVENLPKGYLVKVDEPSQFQMPAMLTDSKEAEKMRVDNKHFISSGLTLWMDLQTYTKAKLNMKLIMYLIVAAGIVVFIFWFLKSHPGFLSILHI